MSKQNIFTFISICFLLFTNLSQSEAKGFKLTSKENNTPFSKKTKTLGICIGAGVDYNYYGSFTQLPLIAPVYDQGIIDNIGPGNIGIGGTIAFKYAHYNYGNGYSASWTNIMFGARGTYHLTLLADKNNKFDPYGGVMAGLRINKNSDSYYAQFGSSPYSYNQVDPIAGLFVGAKYNFKPSFGAFAEVGYDISLFRAGFHINF